MEEIAQNLYALERVIRGVRDQKLRTSGRMILRVLQERVTEMEDLRKRVRSITDVRLTVKQKTLLAELNGLTGTVTFTSAVDTLSRKLNIPYSTVKWNLSKLRAAGLIDAGTKERQNMPVIITSTGAIALSAATMPEHGSI